MKTRGHPTARTDTWTCGSGRGSTAARGTDGRFHRRAGRATGAAVGAGARLPVGSGDVWIKPLGPAPGRVAVGAGGRMFVEQGDVCVTLLRAGTPRCCGGRRRMTARGMLCTGRYWGSTRGAAVGAGARLPLGSLYGRAPGGVAVGARARLRVGRDGHRCR
jgi:hypothetical protein